MDKLCLGVGREIITPPIGGQLYGYSPDIISKSTNDDLQATAFYFKQGDKKALMISITVCEVQTKLCDDIRVLLEEKTGVPEENIMLCATHTHSGPNVAGSVGWGDIDKEYCDTILIPKLVSASISAVKNPVSVRMAVAVGESEVGVNRRQLLFDNRVDFGQNPWGCINKKMTVISFADENDKKIATIIHYGCHGTSAGPNTEITRDWSGIMTDAIEEISGAPCAFFNGTMGDIGPRISNGKTTGDITYVKELGEVAKRDAIRIYSDLHEYKNAELFVGTSNVEIPLKDRISKEKCLEMYEDYKNETENIGGMIKAHLETVMELENAGVEPQKSFEINQTTVSVGCVVFTGIPFEMFSETGLRVDEAVSDRNVLCVSNTNGFEGYFVTEDAICRGGYEVEMFLYGRPQQFCDNADFELMKQMTETIEKLFAEGE